MSVVDEQSDVICSQISASKAVRRYRNLVHHAAVIGSTLEHIGGGDTSCSRCIEADSGVLANDRWRDIIDYRYRCRTSGGISMSVVDEQGYCIGPEIGTGKATRRYRNLIHSTAVIGSALENAGSGDTSGSRSVEVDGGVFANDCWGNDVRYPGKQLSTSSGISTTISCRIGPSLRKLTTCAGNSSKCRGDCWATTCIRCVGIPWCRDSRRVDAQI